MAAGEFIFTPLNDRILRIGTISAAQWNRNRPLATTTVDRIIKCYVRRPGLDADEISSRTLRATLAVNLCDIGFHTAQIAGALACSPQAARAYEVGDARQIAWQTVHTYFGW
jgi:hypothetical protein